MEIVAGGPAHFRSPSSPEMPDPGGAATLLQQRCQKATILLSKSTEEQSKRARAGKSSPALWRPFRVQTAHCHLDLYTARFSLRTNPKQKENSAVSQTRRALCALKLVVPVALLCWTQLFAAVGFVAGRACVGASAACRCAAWQPGAGCWREGVLQCEKEL